jgi:Flp pilus assembly protein TadG
MSRVDCRKPSTGGQALIEFALVLPLLLVLVVNVVNFGSFFFAWITMANAARAGAQYMCLGFSSVGSLRSPNDAEVANVVAADIYTLENRSSLAVRVCRKKSGVAAVCATPTGSGTFTDPAADTRPESPFFVMGWVDVQYTYRPIFSGFSLPGLGIYATLPPLTLHRQSVMRLIQ